MEATIRAKPSNRIVASPAYSRILAEYNARFKASDGHVNEKEFWTQVVAPAVPGYALQSWYTFLKRFKSVTMGLLPATVVTGLQETTEKSDTELELARTLLSNDQATQQGITTALNLGTTFYKDLYDKYKTDPKSLTPFENKVLADALHKAMKSQDSRIHAIKSIKEDGREQKKFDRAFSKGAYSE